MRFLRLDWLPRRRGAFLLLVGIAVSAFLLWVALRKVSYDEMVQAFRGAEYGWLPLVVAIMFASVWLRSERWRLFFDDRSRITSKISFAAVNIGFLFNNLLPQRTGEVARIVAVNQASGVSRVETGATIVAERLTDTFILGVFGLVAWPWLPKTGWVLVVEAVCVAAVVVPILCVAFLAVFRRRVPGIVTRLLSKLPLVSDELARKITRSLADGTLVLLNAHRLAAIALLGFVAWALMIVAGYLLLLVFDFPVRDALWAMIFVQVASNFAVVVPSSPGAAGVFEASVQASLIAFGVGASEALSYAVLMHALAFFPFVVSGLIGVWTVARIGRQRMGPRGDVLGLGQLGRSRDLPAGQQVAAHR